MVEMICNWLLSLTVILGLVALALLAAVCVVALIMFIWEMICP